jgi:hypothetical protein
MFYDGWRDKLRLMWARILGRVAVPVDLPPLPACEPDAPVIVKPAKRKREPYTHIADILAELPNCRRLIKKLKTADEDAYKFHSLVGARVIGNRDAVTFDSLSDTFLKALPASGMIYMSYDKGGERIPPSFMYFTKWKPTPYVVTPKEYSAIYEMTVAYISKDHNRPILAIFHVAVIDDKAVLLKERRSEYVNIPRRTKNGGGGFSRITVGYPRMLRFMYAENKETASSVEQMASELFHLTGNFYAASNAGFQVRAERGGVSVAFNVELRRTAQFFRNRDITNLAADGKRKRIFHYVEAHTRGNGSEVRAHYRGLRRFTWEGNSVVITAPEHAMLGFDAASVTPDDAGEERTLNSEQVARFVRGHLEK